MLEAGAGHCFAETAFLEEVFFEAADLLVQQIVGLVDEADGDVGQGSGWAIVEEGAIGLKGFVGGLAKLADIESFLGIFGPGGVVAGAEVVFVVEEEFLEAGAGDVGELDLGFGGGDGGFAGFGDVLFAGAGGLHHLVDGAVASLQVLPAETVGEVIDDFGFAIGEKGPIAAGFWEETLGVAGHLAGG